MHATSALNHAQKRGTAENPFFSKHNLKKWVLLLEKTLALNEWMKATSLPKEMFTRRSNAQGDSKFMKEVRGYMKLYKEVVHRTKGSQLCITRFHQLLHLEHYVLIHRVMSNFDGSRPEAIGKALIKEPGRKTQKRMSTLTYQSAVHLVNKRNIETLLTHLFVHHYNTYQELSMSCRLEKELLLIQTTPNSHNHDEDSDDSEYSDSDEEDEEEDNERTEPQKSRRKIWDTQGSKFELTVSRIQTTEEDIGNIFVPDTFGMNKPKWKGKEYEVGWDSDLLNGIEDRLWHLDNLSSGVLTTKSKVLGFTEIKNKRTGQIYRAHPSFRSELPWHDWALVEWNSGGTTPNNLQILPARIMMIFEIGDDCSFKNPTGHFDEVLPAEEERHLTNLHRGIYCVVLSANKETEPDGWRLDCKLSKRYEMYSSYNIIPVEAIRGPAYVIEDCAYKDLGHSGLWKNIIHVLDRSEWRNEYFGS